jgi:hypothetical protein
MKAHASRRMSRSEGRSTAQRHVHAAETRPPTPRVEAGSVPSEKSKLRRSVMSGCGHFAAHPQPRIPGWSGAPVLSMLSRHVCGIPRSFYRRHTWMYSDRGLGGKTPTLLAE